MKKKNTFYVYLLNKMEELLKAFHKAKLPIYIYIRNKKKLKYI